MGTVTQARTSEMRETEEAILIPGFGGQAWSVSDTWSFGGGYSLRGILGTQSRVMTNPADEITTGYWLKTQWSLATVGLFVAYAENPGSPGDWEKVAEVLYDENNQLIKFIWDDTGPSWVGAPNFVEVAEVRIPTTKLQRVQNWVHIGLYADHDTNAVMSLYVDGIQALTYTGSANQWLTAADSWAHYKAYSSGGGEMWMDGVYIEDVSAEGDQIPKGYKFVQALPDGAGSSTDWTPSSSTNFSRVNEATAPDMDTTYVESATATDLDLYTFTDLTEGPADELPFWGWTPFGVLMQSYYRMVDDSEPTQSSYDHFVWDGSSSSTDGPFSSADGDNNWYMAQSIFPLQPDGTAWNLVDFNNFTYGVEVN